MLIEKYRLVHFTSQYFLSASNEQPTLVIAKNGNIKPQNMHQIIVHVFICDLRLIITVT